MRCAYTLMTVILIFTAAAVRNGEAFEGFSVPQGGTTSGSLIDKGYNLLYELRFDEARSCFVAWKKANPDKPLADVSIAASYLFEEFYNKHVLTSEFFLNNKRLLGGIEGRPDKIREQRFEEANQRGRDLALQRLKKDPENADALFALTLSRGIEADFTGILEKHPLQSLSLIREAEGYAKRLLALRPDEADAWLAIGAANYIIGSLPAFERFFLWFGRVHGDKHLGMEQLQITAQKGHYLKPFAQIFLALAALREKQEDLARRELSDLVARFPGNPLFADELARLNRRNAPVSKPGGG